MEGHQKFQGGGGLKSQMLEAKYDTKLEFPEGMRGAKQKTFCGEGGVWIFSGTAEFGLRELLARVVHLATIRSKDLVLDWPLTGQYGLLSFMYTDLLWACAVIAIPVKKFKKKMFIKAVSSWGS